MLDYKDIIVKHYGLGMSGREIGRWLNVSKSGVNSFLGAFEACESLSYPLPEGITNYAIANHVYGLGRHSSEQTAAFATPDFEDVHRQLSTRKNMTLVYLWNRYVQRCTGEGGQPYQYRQFCKLYARWCENSKETMHFTTVPGQKMEVDFAGKTFRFVDHLTREALDVVVFVAVLPYSQYIYAEGMTSTKAPQWIAANNHALQYFGGVPQIVVCDNCKQAVIANRDWIAPELNKDYAEWAEHNHTVILPAKVKRPTYKSSVENAVGILEKGIFHDLEETEHFSLDQFNNDLWSLLEKLNRASFKKKAYSRYHEWEVEREALLPLPEAPYEYMECRTVKVSSDYHIRFDNAYYSVGRAYLHKEVLVRASASTVRIYTKEGTLICQWPRATSRSQWSTDPSHLPPDYSAFSQWNATYFTQKAMTVGPCTVEVIRRILASRKFEVQTYRMCQGVLSFARKYGRPALEESCKQALAYDKATYTFIKNRIPAVAADVGVSDTAGNDRAERNAGAYVMDAQSMEIDNLLCRSQSLARSLRKDGDR
jgi:transposase